MNEGRSGGVGKMNYGTIGRNWCPNCAEETIHVKGKCCRTGCTHQIEREYVGMPAMSGGRALMTPRLKQAIQKTVNATPRRPYGQIAERLGVSLSMVKKIAAAR